MSTNSPICSTTRPNVLLGTDAYQFMAILTNRHSAFHDGYEAAILVVIFIFVHVQFVWRL